MLDTATVTSFFTKVQEVVSVDILVGKHLLQVPLFIWDLEEVGVLPVRTLWGVDAMARRLYLKYNNHNYQIINITTVYSSTQL